MKVLLRTYGCRANQYDTEVVRSMLQAAAVEETSDPAQADFAIFNSCTVTTAAESDLRADIRRVARSNPGIRTIVMGCAAAVPSRDETVAPLVTLPTVEAVVPGIDVGRIAEQVGLDSTALRIAASVQSGARALLRIQDGCDEHCTFCASTIARGANRSRCIGELVDEASRLAQSHPEIVITGIHIGTYGRDIGESLSSLMDALVAQVPHVRFRLTSIEATEVDEPLADLFRTRPKRIAPHLHAPLQSGSNAVLKRMGRHWYTRESYADAVERIVDGLDVFALSADVITGFPGETESDHRETVSLVERLPFTSLHVFPYSPRPGTAATRLGPCVDSAVSRKRSAELRELGQSKAAFHERRRVGTFCDVVVTERGAGLTEDYLSVAVADHAIPRRARITGVLRDDGGTLTVFPC